MGLWRGDYLRYIKDKNALLRSDLKPSILRNFGIKATQKQIDSVYKDAYCGWILTGGKGGIVYRHTPIYNIDRLKSCLLSVYGEEVDILW